MWTEVSPGIFKAEFLHIIVYKTVSPVGKKGKTRLIFTIIDGDQTHHATSWRTVRTKYLKINQLQLF